MLVATPILVGSVGRSRRCAHRPVRRPHDVHRRSLASIVPVLAVGAAGVGSYPLLLVFGFFLGIAGTIFAVGIPFVNNWYEPARRGFATGVFGMGMVGTALSAFFTPRFVRWFGSVHHARHHRGRPGVTAALCIVAMRNSPVSRQHRPGAAETQGRGETARDVGDVVPVRGGVRRLRRVRRLSAELHQDHLRFSRRRRRPHRWFRPRGRDCQAGRRGAVRPHRTQVRRARVVRRHRRDGVSSRCSSLRRICGLASTFIALALFLGIGTGGVFAWVARRAPAQSRLARLPESSPRRAASAATSRRW